MQQFLAIQINIISNKAFSCDRTHLDFMNMNFGIFFLKKLKHIVFLAYKSRFFVPEIYFK